MHAWPELSYNARVASSTSALRQRPQSPLHTLTMSSAIGRSAFRATRMLRAAESSSARTQPLTGKDSDVSKDVLRKGAKRDPELFVRPYRP